MAEEVYFQKTNDRILLNEKSMNINFDFIDEIDGRKPHDLGGPKTSITPFNKPGLSVGSAHSVTLNTPNTYGNIIHIQESTSVARGTELFLPWDGISDRTTYPIWYRSHSNYIGNDPVYNTGWSDWRRIAYYDEIESVCREILKSEGLIKWGIYYGWIYLFEKKNGENISVGYICESGDGYIRFSDGTQICYGNVSNAYDGNITEYQKPFLINTNPYVMMHIYDRHYKTTNSSPYVYLYKSTNSNNSQLVVNVYATSLTIYGKVNGFTNDLRLHSDMVSYSTTYFDNDEDNQKGVHFEYIAIGRWK